MGLDDVLLLSYPCGESQPTGVQGEGCGGHGSRLWWAQVRLTPRLYSRSEGPALLPPGRCGGQRWPERLLPVHGSRPSGRGRALPPAGEGRRDLTGVWETSSGTWWGGAESFLHFPAPLLTPPCPHLSSALPSWGLLYPQDREWLQDPQTSLHQRQRETAFP